MTDGFDLPGQGKPLLLVQFLEERDAQEQSLIVGRHRL
jgi:hypothetical protein